MKREPGVYRLDLTLTNNRYNTAVVTIVINPYTLTPSIRFEGATGKIIKTQQRLSSKPCQYGVDTFWE